MLTFWNIQLLPVFTKIKGEEKGEEEEEEEEEKEKEEEEKQMSIEKVDYLKVIYGKREY